MDLSTLYEHSPAMELTPCCVKYGIGAPPEISHLAASLIQHFRPHIYPITIRATVNPGDLWSSLF